MFNLTVTTDTTALKIQQAGIQASPQKFRVLLPIEVNKRAALILRPVLVTPPLPSRPIKWKSRRQQRAYHATEGFGRGIPSARSDTLLSSYAVTTLAAAMSGEVDVINTAPYADYVIGAQQQPFLVQWIPITAAIEPGGIIALDAVETAWVLASDPFGGTP